MYGKRKKKEKKSLANARLQNRNDYQLRRSWGFTEKLICQFCQLQSERSLIQSRTTGHLIHGPVETHVFKYVVLSDTC